LTTLILASQPDYPSKQHRDDPAEILPKPHITPPPQQLAGRSTSATSAHQLLRLTNVLVTRHVSKSFYLTRSAPTTQLCKKKSSKALRIEYKMPLLPLPNLPKNKPQHELPEINAGRHLAAQPRMG
jgi:hypothetical protein